MPHLTPRDVHYDQPLTDASVAYLQDEELYVARKMFPEILSPKQSNFLYEYNKGDLLRNVARKRAPNAESVGSSVRVKTGNNFFCNEWAIHEDVAWQIQGNADQPLNPERDASENVAQWMMTALEVEWAAAYFKAGVWTHNWAGVTTTPSTNEFLRWDQTSANPIQDLRNAIRLVQKSTGLYINRICFAADVWDFLCESPKLVDRVKYVGGFVTTEIFAKLLSTSVGNPIEVLVSAAVLNSATEGPDGTIVEDTIDNLMSNGILMTFAPKSPGVRKPSAGYTFFWTDRGAPNGVAASQERGGAGVRVAKIPMPTMKSNRVEGEMFFDVRRICSDLGLFMDNVIKA